MEHPARNHDRRTSRVELDKPLQATESTHLEEGETAWRARAACADDANPDRFFPSDKDETAIAWAKQTCGRCVVRAACLEEALNNNEADGVWGGLTTAERRRLKRKQAK